MERDLLSRALRQRRDAIVHEMSALLRRERPQGAVVLTRSRSFDLDAFARAARCTLAERADLCGVWELEWSAEEKQWVRGTVHGWREVHWGHGQAEVVTLSHAWAHHVTTTHWVVAADAKTAERLIRDVCSFTETVSDSLLVFEGGGFTKSAALHASIQLASFDALVLPPKLKGELQADLRRFLASRPLYEKHRIPWKRGLLLVGPPGNGKTCALQAMLKEAGLPTIYVKSFKSDCCPEEDQIRQVFERARRLAPAIVVIEDLDSHIGEANRSVFLNELDGFTRNEGLIVLASTNHPERLDPSLLDRPSRFDRKYHFPLPELAERAAYLSRWSDALEPALRLSPEAVGRLAERTGDFTYAYLKELTVSALMAWADGGGGTSMELVTERVLRTLRQELESVIALVPRPSIHRRIGVRMGE